MEDERQTSATKKIHSKANQSHDNHVTWLHNYLVVEE